MSLFGKKGDNSGRTWDGKEASGTNTGIVGGVIDWSDTNEELSYKYPYNNIKKGAVIVVHQNQKAVMFADGRRIETLEPGRHVVDSANIPVIGGLLNIATGGETTYRFEVWFLNMTTERNIQWGFGEKDVIVSDPSLGRAGLKFGMAGNGIYRIKLYNTDVFIDKFVGTEHRKSTAEIEDFFKAQIMSKITASIQQTAKDKQYGPEEVMSKRNEFEDTIRASVNDIMTSQYGLEVTTFSIGEITSPRYNEFIMKQSEGAMEAEMLRQKGEFYHTERQYDIMSQAASNEGAGASMGAGMGLGMGFGMGGAMGNMMQGMVQNTGMVGHQGGQPGGGMAPPPPVPAEPQYFVAVNGQSTGPFGMEGLRQQAAQGILKPSSMIWTSGMAGWAAAESVAALGAIFVQTPPPIVPPVPPVPPTE